MSSHKQALIIKYLRNENRNLKQQIHEYKRSQNAKVQEIQKNVSAESLFHVFYKSDNFKEMLGQKIAL